MHMHLQTKTWLQKLTKLPNCAAHFILIKTIAGGRYSIYVNVCVCVCSAVRNFICYIRPQPEIIVVYEVCRQRFIFAGDAVNCLFAT